MFETPFRRDASLSGSWHPDLMARIAALAEALFAGAARRDEAADFPRDAIALLRDAGLLLAPFPARLGGADLCAPSAAPLLFDLLRRMGGADLSVGRLWEGHVNAIALVLRYGAPATVENFAQDVRDGALSAVWNAEGKSGLELRETEAGAVLRGGKILASGAGAVERPLVTATTPDGICMLLPRLASGMRADLSGWTAQGMRSSATGSIDLTDLPIRDPERIGAPDDYRREPSFSGGAWRFCAVQLGAAERLVDLFRAHLRATGRGDDPYQRQRLALASAAVETAALWTGKAARFLAAAEATPQGVSDAEAVVAYVRLTRMVVERAALDCLESVQRGVGLSAFVRPNPIERIARDLATYLRQPAPDGAMVDAAGFVLHQPGECRDLWNDPGTIRPQATGHSS